MFGRKKKQEEDLVVEDATSGQSNNLELANGDDVQLNDDLSLTDSIPPPPPTDDAKNEEDSRTLEESPSTGANNEAEDSLDDKQEAESIKRKKLILISACIVSFFILLGLAIKYGKTRQQSKIRASSEAGLEDGSFDSQFTGIETEESGIFPTVPNPPTTADDNVVEQNTTQEIPTPTDTTAVDVIDNEITLTNEVDQETSVPSIDPSSSGTSSGTSLGFDDCVANEISVLTTCNNNRVAAVNMSFCLIDEMSDQFWEFVSTPPQIAQVIANNWGFMRDGAITELVLPQGDYEVGIFSNGDQNLNRYPLVTSTQFVVRCGL